MWRKVVGIRGGRVCVYVRLSMHIPGYHQVEELQWYPRRLEKVSKWTCESDEKFLNVRGGACRVESHA